MSVTPASSLNFTSTPPPPFYVDCPNSVPSNVIFGIYTYSSLLLLLPLFLLILYMGFQRRRKQRSASHSDCFTYHCVTMEILGFCGSLSYVLGAYTNNAAMLSGGIILGCIIIPGQTSFHLLTCIERYVAVVHPVTYMRLRERGGVRVRNMSIGCIWFICFGWLGLTKSFLPNFPVTPTLCLLCASLIVILFCCFSVLCGLSHSAPGENRERVDQSKRRAFYIICAILGALLLRFSGLLISFSLFSVKSIHSEDLCAIVDSAIFLSVPSSLVLPLLFLHKEGKLAHCSLMNSERQ